MSLPRAIISGIRSLKGWVFENPSRMQALLEGSGVPGTRAAPNRAGNNDRKYGVRIDHGELIQRENGETYKQFKLQVNKDAENATLRKLAQQDSHKVWAEAEIRIDIGNGEDKKSRDKKGEDSKGEDKKGEGVKEGDGKDEEKEEGMKEKLNQLFSRFEEGI